MFSGLLFVILIFLFGNFYHCMAYIFTALKSDSHFDSFCDVNGNHLDVIDCLSQINVFVGSNNSGKSRLLRELAKLEEYSFQRTGIDFVKMRRIVDELEKNLKQIVENNTAVTSFKPKDSQQFIRTDSILPAKSFPDFVNVEVSQNISLYLSRLDQLHNFPYEFHSGLAGGYGNILSLQSQISIFLEKHKEDIEYLKTFLFKYIHFDKVYVPILRGLNCFDDYKTQRDVDIYAARVKKHYGIQENSNLTVFTGQSLYKTIKDLLLGGTEKRKIVENYQEFLKENFFEGKSVDLIPNIDDDVLHIKIGNEVDRPIYHLGDGLQSLIILTFSLFTSKRGLFFLEEPELHLHPGMQRRLIEVLQKFPQHQYFLSTHSNHFLDLTLDYQNISIFTVKKMSDKKNSPAVVNRVNSGDQNTLRLLGVQNSSVFLANCTIWVEGITDRLYLRRFLKLYIENADLEDIQEDIDYAFVEYGGNNITHWSFLSSAYPVINVERLCGEIFLISDKDKNKNARHDSLKTVLGNRFYCLKCLEIENILSIKTIQKLINFHEKSEIFDLKTIDGYPHKDIKLGTFIELLVKDKPVKKKKYASKTGSINEKLQFCDEAIGQLTYEDMTIEAKSLAKKIYKFVLTNKLALGSLERGVD